MLSPSGTEVPPFDIFDVPLHRGGTPRRPARGWAKPEARPEASSHERSQICALKSSNVVGETRGTGAGAPEVDKSHGTLHHTMGVFLSGGTLQAAWNFRDEPTEH